MGEPARAGAPRQEGRLTHRTEALVESTEAVGQSLPDSGSRGAEVTGGERLRVEAGFDVGLGLHGDRAPLDCLRERVGRASSRHREHGTRAARFNSSKRVTGLARSAFADRSVAAGRPGCYAQRPMDQTLPGTEITALLGRGTRFEGKLYFEGRVRNRTERLSGEIRSSKTRSSSATAPRSARGDRRLHRHRSWRERSREHPGEDLARDPRAGEGGGEHSLAVALHRPRRRVPRSLPHGSRRKSGPPPTRRKRRKRPTRPTERIDRTRRRSPRETE